MRTASILVVDDEADIRTTISDILADEGYAVRAAADAASAREEVRREHPDLILLDVWMPDVDGITLLREWAADGEPRCPVVILSGHGTVETAVEATRLGAVDFVEKPLSLNKLLRTVHKALKKKSEGRRAGPHALLPADTMLVGRSPAMRALRQEVGVVAGRPEPLLLIGDSGSGRHRLARHVHRRSDRREEPFETLAAATVPEANVGPVFLGIGPRDGESAEPGCLQRAGAGTLFIQDLPALCPAGQALLAGILEQGSYAPMGHAAPVPFRARLVASASPATVGRLAPDLLAALGALELRVPPLRDRPEDVTELLRYCVDRLVDEEGLTFRRFSLPAQNRLRSYPWPGNVRELERLVRRLLVSGGGEEIGLQELEGALEPAPGSRQPLVKQDLLSLPLREAREQFERAYLTEQLNLCGGRVGALAKRVGMERTHLYRKLRSLGVDFRQAAEDD